MMNIKFSSVFIIIYNMNDFHDILNRTDGGSAQF